MIRVILAEFYKMRRLKKVMAGIATVNLVPIFILLTLGIFYVKGMFSSTGILLNFKQDLTRQSILGGYILALKTFSWVAWIYVMMLAGEFIAKEFANGSIKLAFTSPINRLSIFFGKFLSLVAYYFLLLFSYLFFFFLIVLLLKYGFRAEIGNYFYEGEYLRILLAYVVIDMSYLALAFLLATISDFVESTIFYNLATIMFLQLFSLSLTILVKSGALTDQFSKYLHKYNYIQTTGVLSFEKMEMYISGKFDKFPVSYEYLFNNFLYTCLFLVVAAWLFQKRDTLA